MNPKLRDQQIILAILLMTTANLAVGIKKAKGLKTGYTYDPRIVFYGRGSIGLQKLIEGALTYFRITYMTLDQKTVRFVVTRTSEVTQVIFQVKEVSKDILPKTFRTKLDGFERFVQDYIDRKHHTEEGFFKMFDDRKTFMIRPMTREQFLTKRLRGD